MKRLLCILGVVFLVSGCMIHEDFAAAKEQIPPVNLVGTWTGNAPPFLWTIKINSDGTGISCYSYNDTNIIEKTKYMDQYLLVQQGLRVNVTEVDGDNATFTIPYFLTSSHKFYKDSNLENASFFCQEKLSK